MLRVYKDGWRVVRWRHEEWGWRKYRRGHEQESQAGLSGCTIRSDLCMSVFTLLCRVLRSAPRWKKYKERVWSEKQGREVYKEEEERGGLSPWWLLMVEECCGQKGRWWGRWGQRGTSLVKKKRKVTEGFNGDGERQETKRKWERRHKSGYI